MNVGRNIRRYRTALGLSQKQVADRIGAHATMISQWENGHRRPSWDRLRQLDEAVGAKGELAAFADAEERRSIERFEAARWLVQQHHQQVRDLFRLIPPR